MQREWCLLGAVGIRSFASLSSVYDEAGSAFVLSFLDCIMVLV